MSDISIRLGGKTEETLKKLKGSDLMPVMRRDFRAVTNDIAPKVRAAARSLPSKRTGKRQTGTSLRRSVANSVKRTVKLSTREVRIAIITRPTGGKSNLGRLLEGVIPWDHPTFGNGIDVHQEPHPFFDKTIKPMTQAITGKVELILAKFEHTL